VDQTLRNRKHILNIVILEGFLEKTETMKKTTAITCLFLDIGGVLLTDRLGSRGS